MPLVNIIEQVVIIITLAVGFFGVAGFVFGIIKLIFFGGNYKENKILFIFSLVGLIIFILGLMIIRLAHGNMCATNGGF